MLSAPTVADLATFTGRAQPSFGTFAAQALAQATLLFSVVTKLSDYPADADLAQLAKNAIMEMADRLYLEQPNAQVKASPFQSETIGSYSYSKGSTFHKAKEGEHTGLFWWDLAIDELRVSDSGFLASGSIKTDNGLYVATDTDEKWILGPAEVETGYHTPDVAVS